MSHIEQNPVTPDQVVHTPPPRPPSSWLEALPDRPSAASQPPPASDADDEPIVVLDDDHQPSPMLLGRKKTKPAYGRLYMKAEGAQPPAKEEKPPAAGILQQRLLILDTWMRSGLPAGDFAPLVGMSKHTLYAWKNRFEADGPAGLMPRARGAPRGSRLPEVTKRAILMIKQQHEDYGVDRISDMLLRSHALQASPEAVGQVLQDDGYIVEEAPMRRHPGPGKPFERPTPSELWQTDLFTFMLKRQNQRVYLIAFMDDHSRFVVSYGLHASQSGALALEVFRAGIVSYGAPKSVYTDNGTQYVTWRGKSQFSAECQKRGIEHIVSSPRRPQSLGKIERFWGSLWRECVETAIFTDLNDARLRIGHYIDHYNFQRPHQGIGGLVPADRFFNATPAVLASLRTRVAANALELARNGAPKAPFYIAGALDGKSFSLHAEGERVILTKDAQRTEVAFDPRPEPVLPLPSGAAPPAPETPPTMAKPVVAPEASPSANAPAVLSPPGNMPLPVSPVGLVDSSWTGTQEQLPGASALDGVLPGTPGTEPEKVMCHEI